MENREWTVVSIVAAAFRRSQARRRKDERRATGRGGSVTLTPAAN